MKNNLKGLDRGFAQIFLLLGMLLVAVSLPIATKLVQQTQENRSSAAGGCRSGDTECINGYKYTCNTTTGTMQKTTTACGSGSSGNIPVCTYTCNWSSCKADSSSPTGGSQTCDSETKSPANCSGGTSKKGTKQNCTYTPPSITCTSYVYSDWGNCVSGTKTRTVTGYFPSGCTGTPTISKILTATCSTTPTTCTYVYSAWSTCVNGKKTRTVVSKTPTGCTGTPDLEDSCTATTSNITAKCGSKNGVSVDYAPNGTEACQNGLISFNDSTAADGTYNWVCKVSSTDSVSCSAKKTVAAEIATTCDTNNGFCTYDITGCTSSKGVVHDSWGCSGGQICCTGVNNGVSGNLYYYYDSSTKTCLSTSVYSSITACNSVKGVCYSDLNSCTSSRSCQTLGGTCKTDCDSGDVFNANGRDECSPAKCCVKVSDTTLNTGGGSNNGGSNTSGGGETTTIPATAIKLSPTTVSLKVGQSAVVTATLTPVNSTDKVIWSSDDGKVATVTADGMIKGVKVGQTIVRALTTSGIEATVAVKIISNEVSTLSFKISFAGIKPFYKSNIGSTYSCIGELGDLTVEILNRPTNTYESHSGVQVAVVGNEVDLSGNQVFQVTNLEIGDEFASVDTFNNVKVKGPFHLKRRMCKDGQSDKLDENTVCDIDLTNNDYVYDFTKFMVTIDGEDVYGLLAGDVNGDGMINSQDFSFVKNAWAADAEPECGRPYDLNLDGVVNQIDKQLVLTALSFKDDE